ncbi:MAG: hypothetical protein ACRBCT_03130 [Alphaproteobacteria bacterium]
MSTDNDDSLERQHKHISKAARADKAASSDLREIDYALGQEAAADAYAWGQSLRYGGWALSSWSADPLLEGMHYFESAASTIPIIGPLIKERIDSSKTVRRIRYLRDAIDRNPETGLYDAEEAELDIILERYNGKKSKKNVPKGFIRGALHDWINTIKPSGLKLVGKSVAKAAYDLSSLPFRASYAMEAAKHEGIQQEQLKRLPETFQASIGLSFDENGNIVDQQKLQQHEKDYQRRHSRRSISLGFSTASSLAAANFIQNEVSKSTEYIGEISHDLYAIFKNDPDENADPITSTFMSAALIFAHAIPATLTLAPLKKASQKVSEHCARLNHVRQYLDNLDHVKNHAQTPEPPPP